MIGPDRQLVAHNLADAIAAVAAGAMPYAGGTELVPAIKLGLLAPEGLVDLKQVPDLTGIGWEGPRLRIGATTLHAQVARDTSIRGRLPMLAGAAGRIGNPRVRWQGTVGGNLVFAEPRSDLIPVFISLGARVRLASPRGVREAVLADLLSEAYTFAREDDELLLDVTVDTSGVRYQHYDKIQLVERPTVGIALVGRDAEWRMVVGAAGYVPHQVVVPRLADIDPDAVAAGIDPIDDLAGSAEYKRHLVQVLARRVLSAAQAGSDG